MSKVFLVEDYDDIRNGMRLMLENKGHEVVDAPDGKVAIDTYEEMAAHGETFDFAFLDYNLPHYKGDTVAVRMREAAERYGVALPRIVVLTGSEDAHMMGRLRSAGVFEVLLKGGSTFPDCANLCRVMGKTA